MGILDDAIRDHLELKRRHGASEQEVAQKEAEVLGPARREPAVTDEGDESPSAPDQPTHPTEEPLDWGAEIFADEPARRGAYAVPPSSVEDERPSSSSEAEPSAQEVAQPPDEPSAPSGGAPVWRSLEDVAPSPPAAAGQRGWLDEDGPPSVASDDEEQATVAEPGRPGRLAPAPPAEAARRADPDEDEQPALAAEHPSERHPRPEEPQAERRTPEEDVLEETPDFLQETPEHERLWFEQRPPRDFDFDD